MLYRRAPVRPPTLLLRIAGAASVGSLIGACSGQVDNSTPPCPGFVCGSVGIALDGGDDGGSVGFPGVVVMPPADDGGRGPCSDGCGAIAYPPDAGPDTGPDTGAGPCGASFCGVAPIPDDAGGEPEGGPCGGGVCGVVVVRPDAGADSGGGPCGGGVCGVIVRPPDAAVDADGASDASADGPTEGGAGGPCQGGPCGLVPRS